MCHDVGMSQSEARKARRECRRVGHLEKTDGEGATWCGRCETRLGHRCAICTELVGPDDADPPPFVALLAMWPSTGEDDEPYTRWRALGLACCPAHTDENITRWAVSPVHLDGDGPIRFKVERQPTRHDAFLQATRWNTELANSPDALAQLPPNALTSEP